PLATHLMIWVLILSLCAIAVCLIRASAPLPELRNRTINLFSAFCLALLVLFYPDHGLLSTMINLLVVACSLKFIMMRNDADFHLLSIVFMFLIAAGFIFNQSLFFALYYGVAVFFVFLITFLLNKGTLSLSRSTIETSKLLLQAVPIAVLIFLVAPRLPPIWQVPKEASTETGLSETLTPGDIANLAKSSELAFRAEFFGDKPSPSDRYWRAIVMDEFDGKTWSISTRERNVKLITNKRYEGLRWEYLINAEPSESKWLYSLDVPQLAENKGEWPLFLNDNYQLFTTRASDARHIYVLNSFYQMPVTDANQDYSRYLQVPPTGNPLTQAYVEKLDLTGKTTKQIIYTIAQIFTSEPFRYTLKPPLMKSDPIDQFLFKHRRGFCSHYASAMAYMLRLAGVPSRLVSGYQGGEDQADSIITVKQYDAHAWIEAKDPELGWIRFDPTSLVAPNRMVAGLFDSLMESEQDLIDDNKLMRTLIGIGVIKSLEDSLVLLNHNWSQMVLGYDQNSQLDIVQKLFGNANVKNLVTFLLFAFAGIAMYLITSFLPWRQWLMSKPVSSETILLDLLRKKGFKRRKHETIKQFIARIKHQLDPIALDSLYEFETHFYALRYANNDNVQSLNSALNKCIKALSSQAKQT
ncbi:MAG: DUF3488 and transglutaminase-like domain-containing protein, partial [Pseudomonadota bacterium]